MDISSGRDSEGAVRGLLDALAENRFDMEQLLRERRLMIHEAHTAGATWAQIAQALGVSRQTVWHWQDQPADETRARQRQ